MRLGKRQRREAGGRAVCEPLEGRVLLSKVGPVVDAGDSRWLYSLNRPESLLRATDIVLVGFEPSSARRAHRLSGALTAKTGALAGYHVLQAFDVTSVLFERTARGPAPALESLQQKVAGFPAVKHLSPTFFNLPDWQRIVVFDSVYVHLKTGLDAGAFFARGFNSFEAAGVDAFYAQLRRGGAIDALRVAGKLRLSADVVGTDVNTASHVILASGANDTLDTNGSPFR
jgi:hypothetical protein